MTPSILKSIIPFLLLPVLTLAPAALAAQDEAPTEPAVEPAVEPSEEATGESGGQEEPAGSAGDTLFVRESLPYVPRSNTVATKLAVPQAWTPFNVGVVGDQLLAEQGARVLGDALENVSGLNVQTGNGVFDFFVVRGFDSINSAQILTDGAPEPETTFYQLYNAERVEVLKGPGGFLYGSNPLAGAVNIVRKQPVPARFGVIGGSFGSFDTYQGNVDLNVASPSGEVSFRLNGLFREGEGYRDGRDFEVWAVNPALTWQLSEDSRLNVNLEAHRSDYLPDAGLPLIGGQLPDGVRREESYGSPLDRSEQEIERFQVDFEHRFSDTMALRNKLYYRSLEWVSDGTLLNGVAPAAFDPVFGFLFPPNQPVVLRSQLLLDDDQELLGNQLELVLEATTGSVRHTLLAGVEVARQTDVYTLDFGLLPPVTLTDPRELIPGPPPVFPFMSGDTETTTVAPYLIDQIAFSDRFQLLVGARYDQIDFEDSVSGTDRSDGEISPMLGLVFEPRDGLTVYANAARSFAPPSPRVTGEREPEESEQLELGLRKQGLLGGRLDATLAVFEIERANIAIPDDNGFTQQAGDQRSRGVELELAGRLSDRLTALFAYAYTDSELTRFSELIQLPPGSPQPFLIFDRSGNRSAFAPEHLANLWLSRRLTPRLRLGLGGRYVGSQFIAEDNVAELDDYVLFAAALSYRFGDWRFNLNLHNLTDEEYETRGFGSTSVIPGDPLAATLSFEYRL